MSTSLDHRFAPSIHLADLCRSVDMLDHPDGLRAFLSDLCTPQELEMLSERWAIAKLMHMGFSYRIIHEKTGASSATIARVSQNLSRGTGELLRVCRLREEVFARQHEAKAAPMLSYTKAGSEKRTSALQPVNLLQMQERAD